MRSKKSEIAPSMSAAAGRLNVDVSMIREAKDAGCPGFDSGGRVDVAKVRKWLARRQKPKPLPSRVKPDPTVSLPGLAASLSRLAAEEQRLSALLKDAIGTTAESGLRRAWLSTSEALRRADSSLAESRRDSGEFLPRADVERILTDFARLVAQSTRDFCHAVATSAASGDARSAAGNALAPARNWILNMAAIATALSPEPIPRWAVEAFGRGASNGLVVEPGDFEKQSDAIRDVIALGVRTAFSEGAD